jgi:hypothetical protein
MWTPTRTNTVILRRVIGIATTVSGYYQIRYTISNSSSNGTVAGGESSFIRNHKSKITSVVATPTDVEYILTRDGSSVSVQWDTSSGFITNDNSSTNDLSITNAVITGLTANTKYFVNIVVVSLQRASLAGTAIRIMHTTPLSFGGTYTSSEELYGRGRYRPYCGTRLVRSRRSQE